MVLFTERLREQSGLLSTGQRHRPKRGQ